MKTIAPKYQALLDANTPRQPQVANTAVVAGASHQRACNRDNRLGSIDACCFADQDRITHQHRTEG